MEHRALSTAIESLDALKVATNDGPRLQAAKAVTVTITVWCYSSADSLDLYYASTVPEAARRPSH